MPPTSSSGTGSSAQPYVDLIEGDCRDVLAELPEQSVNCIVTSPPYFGLRNYDHANQLGLEPTPAEFVAALVGVLREARRVLRDDGTLWLVIGDSYANDGKWGGATGGKHAKGVHGDTGIGRGKKTTGLKSKDLIGIPWRVAFALQADGWYLRQDIIWHKPNPMPESVTDRCTKAHEYVFLLSKSERYYFDAKAIEEPATARPPGNVRPTKGGRKYLAAEGEHHRTAANLHNIGARDTRNKRDVWTIPTKGFKGAHFATFPEALVEPCILAGCPKGGTVLDPFGGSGTVGVVARRNGRNATLIELNPEYYDIASERLWPAAKEAAE